MKGLAVLNKLDAWCAKLLGWVMALMLLAQLAVLFAGVIARYFFNAPFTWSDELASLLLVAITFLGGYAALARGRLAYVSMVVDKFPPLARRVLITIRNLMIIAVCALMTCSIIQMMGKPVVQKQVSATLRMPMKYVYGTMPLAFILMGYHTLIQTFNVWAGASAAKEATGR